MTETGKSGRNKSAQPRPVMLVILDGFGYRAERADNAIALANTPTLDRLWKEAPHAFLATSGLAVGLPAGQMGNSEVGHMNIGAGRVVMQDLPRVDHAIETGEIAHIPALTGFVAKLKASGGACHLIGLVSPGGVHSHQDHAVALARILSEAGVTVHLHAFLDGRDTPPRSAKEFVADLEAKLPAGATIATVSGRYYAMDRDNRWDRVERAYKALTDAAAPRFGNAQAVIDDSYAHDVNDEFVLPAAVGDYSGMRDGDGLLCFNYRADRVREVLSAYLEPGFSGFARDRAVRFAAALGMASYSSALDKLMGVLFVPESMDHLLGGVVADAGLTQLRTAETEKYPHVTYFMNGGQEIAFPGEDRVMIPSPKVATYDLQPEMSAPELTERTVEAIHSGKYDLIILNYANADMVGHTGFLTAAIKAIEAVDTGLGRLIAALEEVGGEMLITADHGNAELMRDPETGGPHTAHTTDPVPVFLVSHRPVQLHDGKLADVAPTVLGLLGLPVPAEMTGHTLIELKAAQAAE